MFLSLIPASMLRLFNARQTVLKALPVDAAIAPLPVAIITLKNRLPSPAVQLFIDCACGVAKTITKTPEFQSVPPRRAPRRKRRA